MLRLKSDKNTREKNIRFDLCRVRSRASFETNIACITQELFLRLADYKIYFMTDNEIGVFLRKAFVSEPNVTCS